MRNALAVYLAILLGALGALELWFRLDRDALFEATHRALFKLAMYRKHGPADVLFLGTSRTGEALRPHAFEQGYGGTLSAFNSSVQYSSLEILTEVAKRIAQAPSPPRLAVVEISRHQLYRAPLPWAANDHAPQDFDSNAFAWLQDRSELVALRKALVLDSLARYLAVATLARRFDGSEQFGVDYFDALLGRRHVLSDEPPMPEPHIVSPGERPALALWASEITMYQEIAHAFAEHGTQLAFFVPPSETANAYETERDMQTLFAVIAADTGATVYDYSAVRLPANDFRDPAHMSHQGGVRLSRDFARLLSGTMHVVRSH